MSTSMSSCPDELTLSVFADGELLGRDGEAVKAHVQECTGCSALVASLRGENLVLREVLAEERLDRAVVPPHVARPGMGIAAAIVIAVLTPFALEWAWQSLPTLPAELAWLSSFGSYGSAMSLSGRLVRFFVGGEDMVVSSIGFSATLVVVLGVLVAMAVRGRPVRGAAATVAAVAVVVFGGLAPADRAHAAEFRIEEDGTVRVDAGETIEDTVFLGGENAIMAGTIDGDLFAGAERVEITGTVHGNIYAAGESVTISGAVDGNVHAAGATVEVGTKVGGSGFLAGQSVTVTDASDLSRGGFMAGESVRSRGRVGRDLFFAADEMEIGGSVERNVSGYASEVGVGPSASVGGDLKVTVPKEDAVSIDGGAAIAGSTTIDVDEKHDHRPFANVGFYVGAIAKALAMLLIALLVIAVFPRLRPSPPESSNEVLKDMGIGFLALVATPVAMVLFAVTIIGIPVAIVLGVVYALLVFLSTLVVADFAGQRLPFGGNSTSGVLLRTGTALLVIIFVTKIPFVGGGLGFLITIFGMGVLLMHLRELYLQRGRTGGTPMGTPGPDAGALPA